MISLSKPSKSVARGLGVLVGAGLLLGGCSTMSGLETKARILAEPPCTDFFFPIYFKEWSAEVSKPAQGVITDAGKHAQGCMIAKVEVVGLADYQGPADKNLELSRQRARNVAAALEKSGLPAAEFHLSALGDAGATTASGEPVPLRRRADVYIRFQR